MYPRIPKLQEWHEQREIIIACLNSLADQLDGYHRNVNKAGLAGNATAVGGTTVGLTAIALSPLCGGASLVPGIVLAGGSGIVGAASSVVGSIAEGQKEKKVFKDVDSLLEEDKRCTEEVQEIAQKIDEAEESIQKFLTDLVVCDLKDDGQATGSGDVSPADGQVLCVATPSSGSGADLKMLHGILQSQLPAVLSKGIRIARSANILNVKRILNVGKTVFKDGAKAGKGAVQGFKIGKAVKVGGVIVTVALLPFEVIELVKQAKAVKEGKGHPSSKEIRDHAKKLKDGIDEVEKALNEKATVMNNLVLLIRYIKKHGCENKLDSLLNRLLKKLLPIKDILKAFDKLDPCDKDSVRFGLDDEVAVSGILINYDNVKDSVIKELAVMIWAAWKMGSRSFVFLQNTGFTTASALWTLFGVSVNSFGTEFEGGVTILLPFDFQGDIVSEHHFPGSLREIPDWQGRCILLTVNLMDKKYTLVNILAPEGVTDRTLFLQEAATFIDRHAEGRIIIAANIQQEVQNMTVFAKKHQVCPNAPWSLMEKFVPYKQVSEYLVHVHPFEANEPGMKVYEICKDFTVGDPEKVFIDWKSCDKPVVSVEDCSKQVEAVLKLGLTELWRKLNQHSAEFSKEERVSGQVVSCSKSLEFFVSCEVEHEVKSCCLDHDLRFLGFLKESVLQFGGNEQFQ